MPGDIVGAETLMIRHHAANLVLRHHIILNFVRSVSTPLIEGRGPIKVHEAFSPVFVVANDDLDGILNSCHGYSFLHHVEVNEGIESQERRVDVFALSLNDGVSHDRQSLILTHNQLVLGQLDLLAFPIVKNLLLYLFPCVYVDLSLLSKGCYLIYLL